MQPWSKPWLFKCAGCGLLASSLEPDIPHEQTATALDEGARLVGLQASRTRSNQLILERLAQFLPGDARRILDVGCGHGLFIKDALARGFRAEGVEPDANVVGQARSFTGAPIRHGYFPDVLETADRYDAIVFNDVLEHIPQAVGAVAASAAHLKPGGFLVLNCPDQRGVFYRIASLLGHFGVDQPLGRMWQMGLPSPHVWYFEARHLVALGERQGLEAKAIVGFSPVSASGLKERISYVKNQSPLMNYTALAVSYALMPFLSVLPKDNSIVFLLKKT
jgi:SAM-dependent methyltransferase